MMAIRNDVELDQLVKGVIIKQAGVLPYIHPSLLLKKTGKSKNVTNTNASSQEYWMF